jgi:hypothetical protein
MDAAIVDTLTELLVGLCAVFFLYGGWLCLRYGGGDEHPVCDKQSLHRKPGNSPIRRVTWMSSLAALAAVLSALATADAEAGTVFEEAMQDYERGEYVRAHIKFRIAAEMGDARAQEVVGLMYAFGPQLYPGVTQDLRAAGGWLDRAARGGRPTARYAYCALVRKELPARAQSWQCFDWVAETGQPARPHLDNLKPGR